MRLSIYDFEVMVEWNQMLHQVQLSKEVTQHLTQILVRDLTQTQLPLSLPLGGSVLIQFTLRQSQYQSLREQPLHQLLMGWSMMT